MRGTLGVGEGCVSSARDRREMKVPGRTGKRYYGSLDPDLGPYGLQRAKRLLIVHRRGDA